MLRYEIRSLGVDSPSYFPGQGVAFEPWNAVAVGVGDTEAEAFDDACNMVAQCLSRAAFLALGLPDAWGDDIERAYDDGEYVEAFSADEYPQFYVAVFYDGPR